MKVITLHNSGLRTHCAHLQDIVEHEYAPDVIVAIAEGGIPIAELMFRDIPHYSVKMQRIGTPLKKRFGSVLKCARLLPTPLKDLLRMGESFVLSRLKSRRGAGLSTLNTSELEKELKKDGTNSRFKKILIVDDAVDSGVTMHAVTESIKQLMPSSEVRCAVITQTTSKPMISPDFTVYDNLTLVRFPWSTDYKAIK